MTSFRQIEANRRNSLKSTGPVTEEGKSRSRRNAIRHGLCAETVIEMVEDIEDYRGFEAAIIADYDARTAVERELVLRLASLLWRLRRATSIETDLLRIQAEILRDRRDQKRPQTQLEGSLRFHVLAITPDRGKESEDDLADNSPKQASEPRDRVDRSHTVGTSRDLAKQNSPYQNLRDLAPRDLAHCFQRLANLDNGVFERLGRYETTLWRQMVQTLLLLQPINRR
jgi:hypothetical protein